MDLQERLWILIQLRMDFRAWIPCRSECLNLPMAPGSRPRSEPKARPLWGIISWALFFMDCSYILCQSVRGESHLVSPWVENPGTLVTSLWPCLERSRNISKSFGWVPAVCFLITSIVCFIKPTLEAKVMVVELVIFQWQLFVKYKLVFSDLFSQKGLPPSLGFRYLSGWSYSETNEWPVWKPSRMIYAASGLCK